MAALLKLLFVNNLKDKHFCPTDVSFLTMALLQSSLLSLYKLKFFLDDFAPSSASQAAPPLWLCVASMSQQLGSSYRLQERFNSG